ncbi:PREDICTED: uncharacterized protein LOC109587888 [Amphimedon queenslandica]|uniref:Death domain-containing protein n=1 Tax=Amphimedon queenslandica TaxID=400682 RepID=A0AAN0JRP1_AMPQE|nr:PREDICTED: uncharacterized protein LOC109587888 [Amphimedon queenslandica]|eukprot:XP_019859667.1 PREDICTED: uncharacterized protein LOC109587888 [Amphimedon queenslandica]
MESLAPGDGEVQQPGGLKQQQKGGGRKPKAPTRPKQEQKSSGKKPYQNDQPSSTKKSYLSSNITTSAQATGIEDSETFTGMLFYVMKKERVIFAAAKNLDALIKSIEAKYPQREDGQDFRFRFIKCGLTKHSLEEHIQLIFDDTKNHSLKGWSIFPHITPCELKRRDIEMFGDTYHAKPPTLLISVIASPDAEPSTLNYPVPIKGIVEPITLNIIIDKATKDNTATSETTADAVVSTKEQSKDTLNLSHLNDIFLALVDNEFTSKKWRKLGLRLGVKHEKLNTFEKDYSDEVERRVEECIAEWLKTGKATYKALVDALKKIDEIAVAINIEKTFIK